MNSVRLTCRTQSCSNTILPATAAANNGYCMPCVQKRQREEREKYIRENRRVVDPYTGISDPSEIIRTLHTLPTGNPLIEFRPPPKPVPELYASLTETEADRLLEIADASLKTDGEDSRLTAVILKSLAIFTNYSLDRILLKLVDFNRLCPPFAFRVAGSAIRESIVSRLDSGTVNPNLALRALAWIGDKPVETLFRQWDAQMPGWSRTLFVTPSDYARDAGWELVPFGCRNLFQRECWAIAPVTSSQLPDPSVRVMVETGQKCACGQSLLHLVEIHSGDSRFSFLPALKHPFSVLTCEVCTCFTDFFFSRIRPDGSTQPIHSRQDRDPNPEHAATQESSPWKNALVTLQQRPPLYAADWCMGLPSSQIGGFPSWIQDAQFPKCPTCEQTMTFIAQVGNEDFDHWEGIYYAFLCSPCRITATCYQQS